MRQEHSGLVRKRIARSLQYLNLRKNDSVITEWQFEIIALFILQILSPRKIQDKYNHFTRYSVTKINQEKYYHLTRYNLARIVHEKYYYFTRSYLAKIIQEKYYHFTRSYLVYKAILTTHCRILLSSFVDNDGTTLKMRYGPESLYADFT